MLVDGTNMENSTNLSISDDPVGNNLSARRGKEPGKNAKKRKEDRLRKRKNSEFQTNLTASLLRRLRVTDPTTVSAIQIQSAIVPTIVPITFRGLPRLLSSVWARMKAIGTRPFSTLATDTNYAIFYKCFSYICEAKLAYAQLLASTTPDEPLVTKARFSQMDLRVLHALSYKLPAPLALYVEAIGNFTVDTQPVVPIMATAPLPHQSVAISYTPSSVSALLRELEQNQDPDNIQLATVRSMDHLPGITWAEVVVPPQ